VDDAAGHAGRAGARTTVRRGPFLAAVLVALAAGQAARAQDLRTLSSSRELHGESALTADVTYAAGRFHLGAAAPGTLYRTVLRYDEAKFIPIRDYDAATGVLRVGLKTVGHVSLGRGDEDTMPSLDLAVAPGVPLTLRIDLGAAEADADFGGLALSSLSYKTGASKSDLRFSRPNAVECESLALEAGAAQLTVSSLGNANCRRLKVEGGVGSLTLDFSGAWRIPMDAEVHLALGSLKLELPRGLGVSISLDRFLASFDQSGFTKRGDVYYSDGYDAARAHLDLRVESAFGGVQVIWLGDSR